MAREHSLVCDLTQGQQTRSSARKCLQKRQGSAASSRAAIVFVIKGIQPRAS